MALQKAFSKRPLGQNELAASGRACGGCYAQSLTNWVMLTMLAMFVTFACFQYSNPVSLIFRVSIISRVIHIKSCYSYQTCHSYKSREIVSTFKTETISQLHYYRSYGRSVEIKLSRLSRLSRLSAFSKIYQKFEFLGKSFEIGDKRDKRDKL